MNLFVHILKIVIPALNFWVLPGMLLFGQTDADKLQLRPAAADVEVAYINESAPELSDRLATLSIMSSDEAVVPHSPAKLTLFYFILPEVRYVATTIYLNRLQVDKSVNSYIRNVFYVFVTALAP